MNKTSKDQVAATTDSALSDNEQVTQDIVAGLSQEQKNLPCKYFYDELGSKLFEAICLTEEYYLTRTETMILEACAEDIAKAIGSNVDIIEPGAGACEKASILLEALDKPNSYTAMDISPEIMRTSCEKLEKIFNRTKINTVKGDFTRELKIDEQLSNNFDGSSRVVFFPGSTIGNFNPEQAVKILSNFSNLLQANDLLLIGVDLIKAPSLLEAAYNDNAGVTAAFNLNILNHANRLTGSGFILSDFKHDARFNDVDGRIEMHLVSEKYQQVTIGDKIIEFDKGESIHTENSYKYSVKKFTTIAEQAGFTLVNYWTDHARSFSVQLYQY